MGIYDLMNPTDICELNLIPITLGQRSFRSFVTEMHLRTILQFIQIQVTAAFIVIDAIFCSKNDVLDGCSKMCQPTNHGSVDKKCEKQQSIWLVDS